jgi:tRNA CCA-adding enzyme
MTAKIDLILKEALERIKPKKDELEEIDKNLKHFIKEIKKRIRELNIKAEIFIGGSYAKKTLIKKRKYDIDIFLRFNKKEKNISELTEKIIQDTNFIKVHGSRDYFRIYLNKFLFFELIPVKKIRNSKEAENITDLSYSHVKYLNKKIKFEKILNEILLAKAFCYAKDCYGAESYIKGFSGYSLELLICHYGGFLNFLKAMTNIEDKEIIDIEKFYKNKQEVLRNLNSSKLNSPIILIDPTYKQRNTLAALSAETFEKFKKDCRKFLKKSSIQEFEKEKIDLDNLKKSAKKNNSEFILLEVLTDKQEGDIAGSKLLKFYKSLNKEILKYFEIKNKKFIYNEKKDAEYIFVVKKRDKIISEGPYLSDKENLMLFKKKHKKIFIRKNKVYSEEKIDLNIRKFIKKWKEDNRKKIKDMSIIHIRIVDYFN